MRIDGQVKDSAEATLTPLGLTLTQAVNIFLHQVILEGGLPFDVRQPRFNAETEAAIREGRDIATGRTTTRTYATVDEFFTDLERDDTD